MTKEFATPESSSGSQLHLMQSSIFFKKTFSFLKTKNFWIIFLITFLGAFLRLYNLEQGMHYLGDEGRDAIIAREIITAKHLTLIGPPTSVGKVFLGPLYFYLVAPFLALFRFEPLGPAIFIASSSVATIVLIYIFTNLVFKKKLAGFLASFLYAISPIAVRFARWPWNPNIMPFFAMIFIISLWQVLEKKKEKWIIITGASLAFILQSHYMGLAAIFVLIASLIFKKPKIKKKKYWLIGLFLFAFLMSPLLLFDLRHGFTNTKGLLEILAERRGSGFSLYDLLSRSRDRIRQIFGEFTDFGERSLLNNLTIGAIFIFWLFSKKKKHWWLVLVWLIFGSLFLGLYQGPFYIHYLEFLLPVCAILLGAIISQILSLKILKSGIGLYLIRYLGILGLIFLSSNLLRQSIKIAKTITTPNVETSKELVSFIEKQSGGKRFNFSLLAENNYDSAYRYFFGLWDIPAEYDSVTEQLFVLCEGEKICQPQGNPKWEIAVFDVAYNGNIKIVGQWIFHDYFHLYHFKPK